MKSNNIKLIITEGPRDESILKKLTSLYFKGSLSATILTLPAEMNIYMLWKKLKEYDEDADFVEIVREMVPSAKEILCPYKRKDISEIFLFFDYDNQQNNISSSFNPDEIIRDMLNTFDNETENGKLYISYPMIEAVWDYKEGMCETFTGCTVSKDKATSYKTDSGGNTADIKRKMKSDAFWTAVCSVFALRCACLYDEEKMSEAFYKKNCSPYNIFRLQTEKYKSLDKVFILSACPEFLLDYFPARFWNSHVKYKNFRFEYCEKRTLI